MPNVVERSLFVSPAPVWPVRGWLLVVALAFVGGAVGQDNTAVPAAAAGTGEAVAPEGASLDAREPAEWNEGARDPELADVMEEIGDLRLEIVRMQQRMDVFMAEFVEGLQQENARLRQELRDLCKSGNLAPPNVPTPNKTLLDEVLAQPAEAQAEGPVALADSGEPPAYETIAEWGRAPEDAAQLTPPAASLKGMILAVPAGTGTKSLEALGHRLREQFGAYDNINIEVFDDAEAARTYNDQHVARGAHRVMSVSKHAASGRDAIVLIQGDKTTEIGDSGATEDAPNVEDAPVGAKAPTVEDALDAKDAPVAMESPAVEDTPAEGH